MGRLEANRTVWPAAAGGHPPSKSGIRDRGRLLSPVAPGMSRDTFRAFALIGVMLNPPPGHLPRDHFNPQDFPGIQVQLRHGNLQPAT